MTNLEVAEAEARDESYCGSVCSLLKVTTILPCYKGRVQGRPTLVLIDTGCYALGDEANVVGSSWPLCNEGTDNPEFGMSRRYPLRGKIG